MCKSTVKSMKFCLDKIYTFHKIQLVPILNTVETCHVIQRLQLTLRTFKYVAC